MRKLLFILICLSFINFISCQKLNTEKQENINTETPTQNNKKYYSSDDEMKNILIESVEVKPISYTNDYVNVVVTIKNNSQKNIRFIGINLYFYDSDNNIIFSDYTNDNSVIRPGANQILDKMIENNGWVIAEAEIDKARFEDIEEINITNNTDNQEDIVENNQQTKLNTKYPIEIISNIIPYGNFVVDREEVKDGTEYFVIMCTDPETDATIGWYYLRKEDEKLFELNLISNELIEVVQTETSHSSNAYKKLLGHWIAENGVEYWYGDGYVYAKSIYGLSKNNVTAYISEKEEIKNYFEAYNEAVVTYSVNDIQNLTEALCRDDIINNCIILQYELQDDFIYHAILIFKDDNTIQVISRFDYTMFGYAGDLVRVDYKTSPN